MSDGSAVLAQGAAERPLSPLDSGEIVEVDVRAPRGTRTRYFRLEELDRGGLPARTVGVARWIQGTQPAPTLAFNPLAGAGLRIENETIWLEAGTRVLHVEQVGPRAQSLIWRELHERTGRTLWLFRDPAGGFQSTEPVGRDLVRRSFGDLALPLHLVERARRKEPIEACARVFAPLEQAAAELAIQVFQVGSGRVLELRRVDGALAGRYAFEGGELVSYQISERGPVGRPIPRGEYEALLRAR